MTNPWLKKNPFMSLWLSGANAVAGSMRGHAAAQAKRQAAAAKRQAAAAMTKAKKGHPQSLERRAGAFSVGEEKEEKPLGLPQAGTAGRRRLNAM